MGQKRVAICIGAPRSGTSWLFRNLCQHPDMYLPPVKEIRHFIGSPSAERRVIRARNILAKIDPAAPFAELDRKWVIKWRDADSHSVKDYSELMLEIPAHEVVVDVSPVYCTAPKDVVRLFKESVGDAKIILFMRNPIDRDFSHAKHYFHMQGGHKEPLSIDQYLEFLNHPSITARNDYLTAIKNWRSIFGGDSIHLEFYDNVSSDPLALLQRVCQFIDVRYCDDYFSSTAFAHFGDGSDFMKSLVPNELKIFLAEKHLSRLRDLAERFPNPCENWISKAENILEGKNGLSRKAKADNNNRLLGLVRKSN